MANDRFEDDYEDELMDDEELLEEEGEEDFDDEHRTLIAGLSGWGISLAAHGLIALILMTMVIAAELERERPPVRLTIIDPPAEVEEEEPPEERDLEEVDVTIEAEVEVDEPVVTDLDLPVEETETEDDVIEEVEEPKGREEAVADAEAGGMAAFMAIGAGGGAKGAFGNRKGGGKRRAIGRNGGNRRSESAVEAALRWFKRHQSPNGMWDVDGYQDNCTDNPKCEPGQAHSDVEGDVACTGYALLCFLGAGYDHMTPNKYRTTVKNGINYLKDTAIQTDQGICWYDKSFRYGNPVATMAVVEAYAMTQDPGLRKVAQGAVDFVVNNQNPDATDPSGYKLGWNYTPSPERHDSSVSGWAIMALKSAVAGGLEVGDAMVGGKKYVELAWKAANPEWSTLGSGDQSKFPYTWSPTGFKGNEGKKAEMTRWGAASGLDRQPIGALCAVFQGRKAGDVMLETLSNAIMAKYLPESFDTTNQYYMYYSTLAIFQVGGQHWKTWNDQVRDMLVEAQRPAGDGCYDGSWDWENAKFHGHDTGRLLSTAYCCLCLEVYYRYQRVGH